MYFYFLKHIIQYSASKKHVFAIENSFSFEKNSVSGRKNLCAQKSYGIPTGKNPCGYYLILFLKM